MKNKIHIIIILIVLLGIGANAQPRRYVFSVGFNGGLHNADYAGSNQKASVDFQTSALIDAGAKVYFKVALNPSIRVVGGYFFNYSHTKYNYDMSRLSQLPPEVEVFESARLNVVSHGPLLGLDFFSNHKFSVAARIGFDMIGLYGAESQTNFGKVTERKIDPSQINNAIFIGSGLFYTFLDTKRHAGHIDLLILYRSQPLCASCIPLTDPKINPFPNSVQLGIVYTYKYGKRI